ncbi:MAG: Ig-like domain-containing protein, partial [Candidatus Zixiibacteriota bacterium]
MTAIPGAAPTQAAIIQSVQRGSSNIGASQNTLAVGLTPVDPTRTIVWGGIPWGGGRANSNAPNVTRVGFDLANSTTLNLQRLGSPGTAADVEWQAIEFASGVTVQRGVSAFGTTTTTVNVPITAVTLSETFVLISVAANTTSATIDEEWTIRAQLTTSTNLALTRLESGIALDVYWQVVSYTGASVQRGLTTLANGVASVTAAITSVDPGTTFLLMNSRGASQNNGIESRYQLRGRITSATQLTFDRISTSNAQNISWEVVSLNDGSSVQSGNIALGTAATSGSATLTSVNTSNTATFISVRGGTGTSTTTLDETSITHTLGSSTSLNVQRAATGTAADVSYFAVEFPANQPPVLAAIGPQNVAEGGHLEFRVSATDPEATTPTLSAAGVPANATFTDSLNGAGALVFDPDYTQAGVINVTVIASDGTLADSEVVAITVTNTNRAPVLAAIGPQNVAEGGHLEFRVSSSDPDATTPSLSAIGVPANAIFTDSLNGAGSLIFDPDYSQAGVINITVIASDGALADSEVVAITVTNTNQPPVLNTIGPQNVA